MNCELFSNFAANLIKYIILRKILYLFLLLAMAINLQAQTPKYDVRAGRILMLTTSQQSSVRS